MESIALVAAHVAQVAVVAQVDQVPVLMQVKE
jgi:hypothetical protein